MSTEATLYVLYNNIRIYQILIIDVLKNVLRDETVPVEMLLIIICVIPTQSLLVIHCVP